MRIAIIGATGFTGRPITSELVQRGHDVVAVVRREDAELPNGCTPVTADVYDTSALVRAFRGVAAVVSAFNPGWQDEDLYARFMAGSRSVQEATRQANVGRLFVVGGAGSLEDGQGSQLIEHMPLAPPYEAGVRAARDYHAEIVNETELDWVFLSPPPGFGPIGPTERRGTYRTGADRPVQDEQGHSTISPADLAIAVADEVEHPAHHHQRFTVAW